MAKRKKSITIILGIIVIGAFSFYGYKLFINPVERSKYICRAGDDTVHPEESYLGCNSIIDWKHCTNGSYEKKSCTEL